jgi:DNA-directed RNA polymerase specialized sigma24 family protein
MAEPTVLSAEAHFESLREAVWVRFCGRHRKADRALFDDLYAEWWAREVERAAKGAASRADSPAAFVAEAVHRVLIDDARARARGLGRGEKGSLEFVDYDQQREAAAADDTAGAAAYESLVHRILTLVQDRLSARETRVFVWSYLYLQPSEATASALGLSLPRVKKDRKRIAGKIGTEVWSVLSGELDLCAAYDEKSLPAVFEILTVHVEDCPVCRAALGGFRRDALAVIGPELLLSGAAEPLTHAWTDALARLNVFLHRSAETLTALPPNGRAAAAVAVAASAVAGGAATVVPEVRQHDRDKPSVTRREARVAVTPRPNAAVTPAPTRAPRHRRAATPRRRPQRQATPQAPAPVPPAAPAREPITFEASTASAARSTRKSTTEFGFEQP